MIATESIERAFDRLEDFLRVNSSTGAVRGAGRRWAESAGLGHEQIEAALERYDALYPGREDRHGALLAGLVLGVLVAAEEGFDPLDLAMFDPAELLDR